MIVVVRSALFHLWFAVVSVVMNIGCLPLLLAPRPMVMAAGRFWAWLMLFGLKRIAGLDLELRGHKPEGSVLIAVKHFSMWETVALQALFADPAIVIKRELLRVPFYGWYCRKMKMIAIDRDAGARSLKAMLGQAKAAAAENRPIVIFPEGTRRKMGDPPDYKPGVAALYSALALPCVPAALNSGLYWQGFLRKPGTVVFEFLEPIPPGLPRREFLMLLETRIEDATRTLIAEDP
jgi:1-acyl-sn-glycerol-3-phosphate acyltransferase